MSSPHEMSNGGAIAPAHFRQCHAVLRRKVAAFVHADQRPRRAGRSPAALRRTGRAARASPRGRPRSPGWRTGRGRNPATSTGATVLMRRILACGLAMMFMLGLAAPRVSAATAGRKVDGTLTGPGGFRVTGCGDVTKIGSGTFHAAGLGNGTYPFTVCIEVFPVITFDGTITLTTAGGATLTGAIGGTGAPEPTFDVVITGGAKQFASAAGALTVARSSRATSRTAARTSSARTGATPGRSLARSPGSRLRRAGVPGCARIGPIGPPLARRGARAARCLRGFLGG